jgi:hypothetical protein
MKQKMANKANSADRKKPCLLKNVFRAVNNMKLKGGCYGLICSEMGYTPTVA